MFNFQISLQLKEFVSLLLHLLHLSILEKKSSWQWQCNSLQTNLKTPNKKPLNTPNYFYVSCTYQQSTSGPWYGQPRTISGEAYSGLPQNVLQTISQL